jgi:hypothetical protein
MSFELLHTFAQEILCIIYLIEITKKIVGGTFAHGVLLHNGLKCLKLQANTFAQSLPLKGGKNPVQKSNAPGFYTHPWGRFIMLLVEKSGERNALISARNFLRTGMVRLRANALAALWTRNFEEKTTPKPLHG